MGLWYNVEIGDRTKRIVGGAEMEKVYVGTLLKKLRQQKNMSQEELAEKAGVSKVTILNIEKGKHNVSKPVMDAVFEAVYADFSNLNIYPINKAELELEQKMNDLNVQSVRRNYDEADKIIKELKEDEKFMGILQNKMFVEFFEVLRAMYLTKDYKKSLEEFKRIFEYTHEKFDIEKIKEAYLTKTEIRLIMNIANMYGNIGDEEKSVEILEVLKMNLDKNCTDKDYKGRRMPSVILSLVNSLDDIERYTEGIELCEVGREICRNTGYFEFMPELTYMKGYMLMKIGDKEEALQLIKQGCNGLEMYGKWEVLKNVKSELEKAFNLTLDE